MKQNDLDHIAHALWSESKPLAITITTKQFASLQQEKNRLLEGTIYHSDFGDMTLKVKT